MAGLPAQLETLTINAGRQQGVSRSDMTGLARGGAGNLVGAAFSAVAGVVLVAVVTRTATLTESGTFFALTSLFLILATLCRLGTPTGIIYFVSRSREMGRPGAVRRITWLAVAPTAAFAAACTGLVILAAAPTVELLGLDSNSALTPLVAVAAFLPFAVVSEELLAATRGLGVMRSTVLVERIGRTSLQLALVALAAPTGSLPLLVVAWAAPYLPAMLMASRSLDVVSPSGSIRPDSEGAPGRREFWRFTAPCSVASLVQISLQRLDILLVAAFLGPGAAAVYTAATRVVVVGQLGNQAVSLAAQPRLGAALARGDIISTRTVYRTATGWLVLLNWPLFLLSSLFAEQILAIFGLGADPGRDVVLVLSATMMVASSCGMVDMVLSMSGRTSWNLYNSLAALTVAIGLNVLLIPRMGIVGAAIAWSAAILVNNLVPLIQIFSLHRLHPLGAGPLIAMGVSATAFGLIPGLALLVGPDWSFVAATVLGFFVFAGGCWYWRQPLHLDILAEAIRRPKVHRG